METVQFTRSELAKYHMMAKMYNRRDLIPSIMKVLGDNPFHEVYEVPVDLVADIVNNLNRETCSETISELREKLRGTEVTFYEFGNEYMIYDNEYYDGDPMLLNEDGNTVNFNNNQFDPIFVDIDGYPTKDIDQIRGVKFKFR